MYIQAIRKECLSLHMSRFPPSGRPRVRPDVGQKKIVQPIFHLIFLYTIPLSEFGSMLARKKNVQLIFHVTFLRHYFVIRVGLHVGPIKLFQIIFHLVFCKHYFVIRAGLDVGPIKLFKLIFHQFFYTISLAEFGSMLART